MKIDIFNHLYPKRFFDEFIAGGAAGKDMGKRVSNIATIVDLDARFRAMDEFGDFRQVLTLPSPPLEVLAGPDRSPGWPGGSAGRCGSEGSCGAAISGRSDS